MRRLILILVLSIPLHACTMLGAAAVGAGATAAVYDHRSLQVIAQDNDTNYQIQHLFATKYPEILDNIRLNATTFHNIVLLTGSVPNPHFKKQISELILKKVPHIKKLYNEMRITSKKTSFATLAKDTYLTAKIKTRLLQKEGLRSSDIKVVTDNANVFLMGAVEKTLAKNTVSLVRKIPGIKRIVTLFSKA
jgi:osmotically-inducible protein OsmY